MRYIDAGDKNLQLLQILVRRAARHRFYMNILMKIFS